MKLEIGRERNERSNEYGTIEAFFKENLGGSVRNQRKKNERAKVGILCLIKLLGFCGH